MVKLAIIFSDGTEEIEAVTVIDGLRRAGAVCDIVSERGEYLTGSHGIVIKSDKALKDFSVSDYDGIIIPGGMPGASNISANEKAIDEIKKAANSGKLVASICASPAVVLAKHGICKGKRVTCFPAESFIETVKTVAVYTGNDVEKDGNFITANGPLSATKFAIAIADYFGLKINF